MCVLQLRHKMVEQFDHKMVKLRLDHKMVEPKAGEKKKTITDMDKSGVSDIFQSYAGPKSGKTPALVGRALDRDL